MRTTSRLRLVMLLLPVLALAGCGELVQQFKDISALRATLNKVYGEQVGITIHNGNSLILVFQNSPRASLPEPKRREFAFQAAKFAKSHYVHPMDIGNVTVAFQTAKSYGIVNTTNTDAPYQWIASELRSATDPTAADTLPPQ